MFSEKGPGPICCFFFVFFLLTYFLESTDCHATRKDSDQTAQSYLIFCCSHIRQGTLSLGSAPMLYYKNFVIVFCISLQVYHYRISSLHQNQGLIFA